MTLKQWLYTFNNGQRMSADLVAAYTDSYFADHDRKAAAAFNAAFLRMQSEIPVIDEKGAVEYRDGRKGTYAQNEDIQAAIGPILQTYGFFLTFETSYPREHVIHVDGVLTHKRGHIRRSAFESFADTTGGKSHPQARGSIISYGQRYTTCDLLNIQTRGADDDGRSGLPSRFEPEALTLEGRAAFGVLMRAACDSPAILADTWAALPAASRSALGVEGLDYIKRFAHVG